LAVRRLAAGVRDQDAAESQVTFLQLDNDGIDAYLKRVHTLDKAGAYSIQDHRELIVAGYRGSFTNIMGLPLTTTKQILTRCGLRL
jgi:septum formation protein